MRSVQGTGMKRLFQVTTALSCSTSYRSRNSVASLVIGIWAGHQSRHVSIPDMDKRFISSPKRPDWLQWGAVQWVQSDLSLLQSVQTGFSEVLFSGCKAIYLFSKASGLASVRCCSVGAKGFSTRAKRLSAEAKRLCASSAGVKKE